MLNLLFYKYFFFKLNRKVNYKNNYKIEGFIKTFFNFYFFFYKHLLKKGKKNRLSLKFFIFFFNVKKELLLKTGVNKTLYKTQLYLRKRKKKIFFSNTNFFVVIFKIFWNFQLNRLVLSRKFGKRFSKLVSTFLIKRQRRLNFFELIFLGSKKFKLLNFLLLKNKFLNSYKSNFVHEKKEINLKLFKFKNYSNNVFFKSWKVFRGWKWEKTINKKIFKNFFYFRFFFNNYKKKFLYKQIIFKKFMFFFSVLWKTYVFNINKIKKVDQIFFFFYFLLKFCNSISLTFFRRFFIFYIFFFKNRDKFIKKNVVK